MTPLGRLRNCPLVSGTRVSRWGVFPGHTSPRCERLLGNADSPLQNEVLLCIVEWAQVQPGAT